MCILVDYFFTYHLCTVSCKVASNNCCLTCRKAKELFFSQNLLGFNVADYRVVNGYADIQFSEQY